MNKNGILIKILRDNLYLDEDNNPTEQFSSLLEDIKLLSGVAIEFEKSEKQKEIDEIVSLIEEYNIPRMISGNKPFKSNKTDLNKALIRFFNSYKFEPNIVQSVLFSYINKCINNESIYNPSLRTYIWHRDKGSQLADDCESYINGELEDLVYTNQRTTLL